MKLDGLADERQGFVFRFSRGDASRQIWDVRAKGRGAFFDNYEVAHFIPSYFLSPACFSALLSVPGGISMLGFPATVTVPGLLGW